MEILFFLRGYLSTAKGAYAQVDLSDFIMKSGEYFRKALRPLSPSSGVEGSGANVHTSNGCNSNITVKNSSSSTGNDILGIAITVFQKFYDSINRDGYLICSTEINLDCGGSIVSYTISVGSLYIACYEMEKLHFFEMLESLRNNDQYGESGTSKLYLEINLCMKPIQQSVSVFLLASEKVCVQHNTLGTDFAVISAIKAFIRALNSLLLIQEHSECSKSDLSAASSLLIVSIILKDVCVFFI